MGDQFIIEASVGHIRDLATKDLGVDIENDFTPTYVVSEDKSKVVKQLKKVAKSADKIFLATDPDREGEAISWHILELLKPKVPVHRLVFNEITKTAILDSINNPKNVNMDLVHAQESRRILDRLFGFLVSIQTVKLIKFKIILTLFNSISIFLLCSEILSMII